MKKSWEKFLLCLWMLAGSASAQDFSLSASRLEIVAINGFNHVPLRVAISGNGPEFQVANATVMSDARWVLPSIDVEAGEIVLSFVTSNLVSTTNVANVEVSDASGTSSIVVEAVMTPLTVVKLLDDPLRSRTYAIHRTDTNSAGALVVIDPSAADTNFVATPIGNVTIPRWPSDMAITGDGLELLMVHGLDGLVSVVNLNSLDLTESIALSAFDVDADSFNYPSQIAAGESNTFYYTDWSRTPKLRVFDRSSGQVVQTLEDAGFVMFGGTAFPAKGFGAIGISPDGQTLFAWRWDRFNSTSWLSRFDVAGDGTLSYRDQSVGVSRPSTPVDTRILFSRDGQRVFFNRILFEAGESVNIVRTFPEDVQAILPGGELALTDTASFDADSGLKLGERLYPPGEALYPVIECTSDYAGRVEFDPYRNTLIVFDWRGALDRHGWRDHDNVPRSGISINAPRSLRWHESSTAIAYDVYLGASSNAVSTADTNATVYLGRGMSNTVSLAGANFLDGTQYYWRVDPVNARGVAHGETRAFTVLPIASDVFQVSSETVVGHDDQRVSFAVSSSMPGQAWQASANQSWVGFVQSTGVTPAQVEVVLDASGLAPGEHRVEVTVSDGVGSPLIMPVVFVVHDLKIQSMTSDPISPLVYAISEDVSYYGPALLLEIDSAAERIQRVVRIGRGGGALAVHRDDGRIYVASQDGEFIHYVERDTLGVSRVVDLLSIDLSGVAEFKAKKMAAAGLGRLMLETENPSDGLALFDTVGGSNRFSSSITAIGGGQMGSGNRFYFHGDSDFSRPRLRKYDTANDQFVEVLSVEGTSFGSDSVHVRRNGDRVFWGDSAYDSAFNKILDLTNEIHAVSANGRLAFVASQVFDVDAGGGLYTNTPSSSGVFNDASSKLVYNGFTQIGFFSLPLQVPAAPYLLSPESLTNQIRLRWQDVANETGFFVERSDDTNASWQVIADLPADSTEYVDSNLVSGVLFHYRLSASNGVGVSLYSPVRSAQLVGSVEIPVLTSVSASVNQVWLSWPAVADADGIVLQRALNESGPWMDLSELEPGVTQATDQTVSAGASYFYRLVATNHLGNSSISAEQSVSVPTVPEGVSGLSTNGLLAYWSFDQPVGSMVVSEEFSGFNGVLSESGASIETNGIHGNALNLSRSLDGFMDAGDVLDLTNMNFTISCWFRTPVGESRDNTILIHKHVPGHRNGYFMGLNTTAGRLVRDKGYFYVGDENQSVSSPISTADTLVSSTDVNDGDWHQITVVHGNGTTKRLYVDGVLEDLLPFEGFTANSNHFVLGGHGDGVFSGAFEGQIDEVRVYDRLLSSTEVATSYHRFVPAPPLVSPVLSQPVFDFNAVVLSWSDVAGETNYVVERRLGDLGSWSVLTNIVANGTNAWDFDIQSGQTYWYRVTAEGYGESSPVSVEQSIAIPSISAPSAPVLGLVVLSANSIALSWGDVTGENYYILERSLGSSGAWSVATAATTDVTNHVDAGLLPNQTYRYRIKAVNFAGPSPYSEIITGVTLSGAPGQTLLTVELINGDVPLLNWTDVTNESAYRVERTLDPGLTGWIVLTNQLNNSLYDWQRIRGATNHYRVIAVNALGESPPSNVEKAIIIDPYAMDRPVLYPPMPTTNSIGLSWSVITNASNYVLERSIASSTNWSVIAVIPYGSTNHIDTNVVATGVYFYRLKATNAQRESEYSHPVTAGVFVPNPPVAPLLTIDSVSKTGVGLYWSNPTNETHFEVERSLGESNLWTRILTASANTTNHTDTNVAPGSLYNYRVRAGNADGDSPYSNIGAVHVPDPQPPSAPSNLNARPLYPALVKLSWGNLTNETAFRVERRTDAGSWGQLTQLGADELSFVDSNVVVGTRYHYRVIAVNSLGDSPPSNEDSIVPFAEAEVLVDDFDNGLKPGLWTSISGGVVTNGSGFNGSPALYFNAADERFAITSPLDVSTGGYIVFQFRGGDQGVEPWELPEPGRWVIVEYTVDDGNTWVPINGQAPLGHLAWTEVVLPIPAAAQGPDTCFRWRQLSHAGTADNWGIDDVSIRGSLPPVPAQVSFLLTHTQSGREIVLAWVKAARATYFRVERATATEAWTSVATVSASKLTITDGELRPGTIYYYRIVAVNAGGAAPASNAAQAETWPSLDHWNHENYGNRNAGDFSSMGNLLPDGSRQILRYAFRMSAQEARRVMSAAGDSGYPRIIFDQTRRRLCVQFVRRKPASQPGIAYRVEFSDDFSNWFPGGNLISSSSIDSVWEKVEFEDTVSANGRDHRYSRVVVEILP